MTLVQAEALDYILEMQEELSKLAAKNDLTLVAKMIADLRDSIIPTCGYDFENFDRVKKSKPM